MGHKGGYRERKRGGELDLRLGVFDVAYRVGDNEWGQVFILYFRISPGNVFC